jgi:ligand-binding SRPBCC domain-containing protein
LHRLKRSVAVNAPLDTAFRFFADPRNLPQITPKWVRFEVVHLEAAPLRAGTTNEYRIRWFGVPLRWRSFIPQYDEPHRFVDEQVSGPYAHWRHEHVFRETESGTEVRDLVEYSLPLWFIGSAVHALIVRRQLDEIFDYRERALPEIFAAQGRA